jgi:peptidoglycan glycosyltransferase
VNKSISRLFAVLAGGFVLLAVVLGYWQIVHASAINDRPGNSQTIRRQLLIARGPISAADGGKVAVSISSNESGQIVYHRTYPAGTLAPQTIGYANEIQGTAGLERSQNGWLTGDFGAESLLVRLGLRAKRGAAVQTTLMPAPQTIANQMLAGHQGAVVALDPRTGAVDVMSSAPNFDLNQVATNFAGILRQPGEPLLNRAVQGLYPPGSTFKVVTATAALESALYTPQSMFNDTGQIIASGHPLQNFNGEKFGPNTLTQALTYSINTTFGKIGLALGAARLGATMTAFGFGRAPSVDLPPGAVATSGRKSPTGTDLPSNEPGEDVARIGIGQEQLLVTPLQMAMVAAGIANQGAIMNPYLVQSVTDTGGSVLMTHQVTKYSQATTPTVAAEVTDMMRDVVKEGTGTAAALAGLDVAGKTGTAQTATNGLYDAWFIGFAPAAAPRVAVAVVVENSTGTGGVVAAPIARAVMQAIIARSH